MDVDLSNFEREDFSIDGFYRGFVEDNVDPKQVGRVRVRILGIHSMDVLEAPTENLPWAEPVIPLAHSGGANLQNPDMKPGVSSVPLTKYTPLPVTPPLSVQLPVPVPTDAVNAASTEFATIPLHKDASLCNSGTGGHFSVPAKGSLVWIFFDGGCHLRPQYFGMATQARDWVAQKKKLVNELSSRDNIINNTFNILKAASDTTPHPFTGAAMNGSKVVTNLSAPQHIPIGGTLFDLANRMENISSWTSPGGTTIMSNHTFGKEQLYIFHKGYSFSVNEKGQVYKVVGSTSPAPTTPFSGLTPINHGGLPNDETEINSGLKNIYVVGDYNLLVMGNCFIQCHQSVQINAMANVGVVARTGNVNVLAETQNINLEATKGSVNIKGMNVQIEADNNIFLKSNNAIDLNSRMTIQSSSASIINDAQFINSKAAVDFKVEATSVISMTSNGTFDLIGGASLSATSPSTSINGDATVIINSKIVEVIGSAGVTVQGTNTNIKGNIVNVNGDGTVNILGSVLNAFANGTAMIGAGGSTVMGGSITTLTGIVTLGIGSVAPAAPANPATLSFTSPPATQPIEYATIPPIAPLPDLPIVPTPSKWL